MIIIIIILKKRREAILHGLFTARGLFIARALPKGRSAPDKERGEKTLEDEYMVMRGSERESERESLAGWGDKSAARLGATASSGKQEKKNHVFIV